ncbi:MAG: Xylose isomerase domain protein barrel [Herbinix sp.]|jgi:sugar phosphate isomerase/epimerase|nr:Xylose isomerase domain protein barrel [Herbinix sp.]
MDVSLQLYSINQETKKDFKKSVEKVSEIGYNGVEFAGYGDLTAAEVADLLKETNLYSVGSHCGLNAFTDTFEETLAFNKTIGSKYIICPWAKVDTKEEIDTLVQALNAAGDIAAEENIKVGYHNHAHEFVQVDGKYALDIIAENTNDNVVLELDVFWVAYAGIDPIEYIKKWGKKVELIHVKQINENKANVDVADGILDMKKIKEAAEYATYFVVEHEEFDKPVWDAIRNDYEALSQM